MQLADEILNLAKSCGMRAGVGDGMNEAGRERTRSVRSVGAKEGSRKTALLLADAFSVVGVRTKKISEP